MKVAVVTTIRPGLGSGEGPEIKVYSNSGRVEVVVKKSGFVELDELERMIAAAKEAA